MRYLLDTNIVVFLITGKGISKDTEQIIDDYVNRLYVSSLSIMEVSHLIKNDKIKTSFKSLDDLILFLKENYYIDILQTKNEHIEVLGKLRQVENHSDPIDHFIISQAICEKLCLISSDTKFDNYKKQKLNFIFNKR